MEPLCPSVQSSGEAVRGQLTLGGILRAFLPVLLHLLNLGAHKLRVLWQLAACGTPALGANLFHCPHCKAPTLGAALLRQPALSALPGRQKLAMARKADTESLTELTAPPTASKPTNW